MIEQEIAAGQKLDALVAEKVMGWRREGKGWYTSPGHRGGYIDWEAKGEHDLLKSPDGFCVWFCGCRCETLQDLPAYSTDIAAAWTIALHLIDQQMYFDVGKHMNDWHAFFNAETAVGDTAPLAICRAALKAVERKEAGD